MRLRDRIAALFGRLVTFIGLILSLLGLALGVLGLTIDWFGMTSLIANGGRSFLDLFVFYWTYFTHLTNLGLVLVYLALLTTWRWLGWFRAPVVRAILAAYIALVMGFFHFMLAPLYDFEGLLAIGNVLLHYLCPILYLAWWLAFAPHGTLRYRDIPLMLAPGVIYVAWVLVRGAVVGQYPYPILDPTEGGYGSVALGGLAIAAAMALFSAALIWVDGRLAPTATHARNAR